MIGFTLSLTAGYLAMGEADVGNLKAAEAALADNRRLMDMAIHDLPPGSFSRQASADYMGWYGFPGGHLGYGGYAPAFGARDYETVRVLAMASVRRLEQLKPGDADDERTKRQMLAAAHSTAAFASYQLKDYVQADAEIKRALEVERVLPKHTLFEQRSEGRKLLLAAMIAARQQRYAEAQQIIAPVLKLHRQLHARKDNDDLTQHLEYALALYASALAAPGQKQAQLTQAAAIMDGLPTEMRSRVSVSQWREQIAEEQKKRH
jgi:hypothetical protein